MIRILKKILADMVFERSAVCVCGRACACFTVKNKYEEGFSCIVLSSVTTSECDIFYIPYSGCVLLADVRLKTCGRRELCLIVQIM